MTKDNWIKGIQDKGIPAKCVLFTVELIFEPAFDKEGFVNKGLERWYIHNQNWKEITLLRETLFTHGFFLERSPGRGEIIMPMDFRKILIDVQREGFKDNPDYSPIH